MPGTFVRPVFIRALTEAVAGTTAVTIFRPTTHVDVPLNVWMVPSRSAPITLWYWAADTSLHAFGSLAALKAGAPRASEPAMAAVTMSFFNVVPLGRSHGSCLSRRGGDHTGREVEDDRAVRAHLRAAGWRLVRRRCVVRRRLVRRRLVRRRHVHGLRLGLGGTLWRALRRSEVQPLG